MSWLFILLFGFVFFGLLVAVAQLKHTFNWTGEFSRKVIHALLGLATLSFPWLFENPLQVWILAAVSLGILAWARWRATAHRDRGALHDVDRQSLGDLCYPVAIAFTFQLAQGEVILFIIPVLVLALADAAGAVIGSRYGRMAYRASDGQKSVEGSFSIGVVAFLSVHIPLLLMGDTSRAESLLIAAVIAILITAVESIAIRGLDNIYIPLVVFLLMVEMVGLDSGSLLRRLLFLCALILLGLLLRRRSQMSGGAAMTVLIIFYLVAIGGGILWVVPPLYTLAIYFWNTLRTRETAATHEIPGILAVAGSGLFWMILGGIIEVRLFWPFLTAFAIAAAHIHLAGTLFRLNLEESQEAVAQAIGIGWIPLAGAALVSTLRGFEQPRQGYPLEMGGLLLLGLLAIPLAVTALHGWQFKMHGPKNDGPRWLRQTCVNLGVSSVVAAYSFVLLS